MILIPERICSTTSPPLWPLLQTDTRNARNSLSISTIQDIRICRQIFLILFLKVDFQYLGIFSKLFYFFSQPVPWTLVTVITNTNSRAFCGSFFDRISRGEMSRKDRMLLWLRIIGYLFMSNCKEFSQVSKLWRKNLVLRSFLP